MKLKHRITGTILAIAFATTSALPAATIPQLKTAPVAVKAVSAPRIPVAPPVVHVPKVATPPKVPVVKVLAVPKIVAAPKVPSVKVPVTPKIPAAPKLVTAPKVPVVKVPAVPKIVVVPKVPSVKVPLVQVPIAPKTPSVPRSAVAVQLPAAKVPTSKAPSFKLPQSQTARIAASQSAAPAVQSTVKVAVRQVDQGKLRNVKERLPIEMKSVETNTVFMNGKPTKVGSSGKGSSFVRDNFGTGGNKKPGSIIDHMKANSGKKDRNPASGSPMDQMRGDKNSQASDGLPAWMGSKHRNGADQAQGGGGAVVTHGSDGSTTVVKNGTTTTLYKDGTVKETDPSGKTTTYDPAGTPVPDDMGSSGRPVFTKETAKGIQTRKGGTREPVEESSGSTGPVNTGANGTGKFGSLSQPIGDKLSETRATQFDSKGIQTRIESRINTGGR